MALQVINGRLVHVPGESPPPELPPNYPAVPSQQIPPQVRQLAESTAAYAAQALGIPTPTICWRAGMVEGFGGFVNPRQPSTVNVSVKTPIGDLVRVVSHECWHASRVGQADFLDERAADDFARHIRAHWRR